MSKIVAAYVSRNAVDVIKIPILISRVHGILYQLSAQNVENVVIIDPKTDTEIVASCKREWLISFIDGQPSKSLKRHLDARVFTPESYRTRYALPPNYPMVAPAYAARRSQIAKHTRLGHKST